MKRTAMLCLAIACAGCSSVNVSGQGGNSPPQAGAGARGGSASVQLQNTSAAGVIVTVAIISAVFGPWRDDSYRRDGPPLPGSGRVPGMLEGRAIAEVDCTRPLENWSANLRCR